MITVQDIKDCIKNNTPVGLASWCWSTGIQYDGYLNMCKEHNIEPITEEEFNFVNNWWEEQYYA